MSPAAERSGTGGPGPGGRGPADTAIVTGATGLVGRHLLPLLLKEGFQVRAVSRRPPPGAPPAGLRWLATDLSVQPGDPAGGVPSEAPTPGGALFHTAPLWLLPAWLDRWADRGVRRVVALSSTSRSTKAASSDVRERDVAHRLARAEEAVETICARLAMPHTLLRPTLVYDGESDRNVSDIARFVRRLRFLPVAGRGSGRRQPVHAADLAGACLAVRDEPVTFGRNYHTPGGETLTFAEMACRIARGAGVEPRLLHLPLPLLRMALVAARRLPGLGHLSPRMADRMDEDLVFDASDARRDFGYAPRPFRYPVTRP